MPSQLNEPPTLFPLTILLEATHTTAPSLFLITGSSGAGKTSWCVAAARLAHAHALPVGGLLSPAVMDGPHKIAIDLLDLSTGERRRLAQRSELPAAPSGEGQAAGPVTGIWRFEPAAIAWGNGVLGKVAAGGLVFVDEMGPLEFEQGQGLQAGLQLVDAGRYRVACVTVRPSLLESARVRWPHAQAVTVGDDSDD